MLWRLTFNEFLWLAIFGYLDFLNYEQNMKEYNEDLSPLSCMKQLQAINSPFLTIRKPISNGIGEGFFEELSEI